VELRAVSREGRYSKWALLANYLSRLPQFDRVLLKDADQRLAGFPWATLVEKGGKAVIAGALRQSMDEGLIRTRLADDGDILEYGGIQRVSGTGFTRQYFQYNNAAYWKRSRAEAYLQLQAQPVNFVEQYFALLDTKFASYFFGRILAKKYEAATSWGPDAMWCGAAHEWFQMQEPEQVRLWREAAGSALTAAEAGARQPCVLVPLVTNHEDTRQIEKTAGARHGGDTADTLVKLGKKAFEHDFKEWFAYSLCERSEAVPHDGRLGARGGLGRAQKNCESGHWGCDRWEAGTDNGCAPQRPLCVSRSVQRKAGQPCNPGAPHGIQQMCPGENPCPTCGEDVLKCRCPSEAIIDQ
jgi:hypothetical protein